MSWRYDELVELYLDGSLEAEQASELRQLVIGDPVMRGRFVADVRFAVLLGVHLHRSELPLADRVAALLDHGADGPRVAAAVISRLPTGRYRKARGRLRHARPRLLMYAAIAALLALAAGLGWQWSGRADWAEADHHAMAEGGRLGGGQVLRFRDGTEISAGAGADIELVSVAPKRLRLHAGSLDAVVAAQPAGRAMTIATAAAEATIVGTEFTLAVEAAGTRLSVRHGLVRLATASAARDVAGGQAVTAAGDGAIVADLAGPGPQKEAAGRLEPGSGRPFRAKSPWNTTIAAGSPLDGASRTMIAHLLPPGAAAGGPAVAVYEDAIPVYDAGGSPRRITVEKNWGPPPFAGKQVRIPDAARPNRGNGSLVVVDWEARRTWEFWRFAWNGEAVACTWGGSILLDGDGTERPTPGHAGGSLLAGLIRLREVAAREIPHALAFASSRAGKGYRFPAYQSDGVDLAAGAIPVGARLQLDPAIALEAIPGITPGELAIGRALQRHGAYCVGRSAEPLLLFSELDPGASDAAHPGAVYAAAGIDRDRFPLPHLPWDALRVLE